LRVPKAKLAKRDLDSAEQRVVTLRELLGEQTPELAQIQDQLVAAFSERFGLQMAPGELSSQESKRSQQLWREEIGRDDFVSEIEEPPAARGDLAGEHQGPGGTIKSYIRLEGPAQNRIRAALLTGDFFIAPPRVIYDLEACLRGVYIEHLDAAIRDFFDSAQTELLSVSADDFIASIRKALGEKDDGSPLSRLES
jgi:lipoate-protein ligase A